MYLKYEFEKETGEGASYLEGKEKPEDNGTYNDTYVKWLQEKVKKLMLTDVSITFLNKIKLQIEYHQEQEENFAKAKDYKGAMYHSNHIGCLENIIMWNKQKK